MDTNIQAYTEVNSFLSIISEKDRNTVPKKLRSIFEEKSKEEFQKSYNFNEPLYKQDISRKALAIIALLHINYWCKNEQEKNEVWSILKQNEQQNEEEKRKKYDIEKIFNNRQIKAVDNNSMLENEEKNTEMIVYEENVFKKIINRIKKIFKR